MNDNDASKSIAKLSPEEKRALLAQLLRKKAQAAEAAQKTQTALDVQNGFPLSQGQRALWFLFRLAPESAAYNILYAARVHIHLDIAALQHSMQALVRRYPILTATYTTRDGEPVHQFHEDAVIPIEVIDASRWNEEYLHKQLYTEGKCPFDLEHGPVLRLKVFQLGVQDTILSLTIHHIATDLWSLDLLIDELLTLYTYEQTGIQAILPSPGKPFTEYVQWQREMLAGPEGERHWHYWQQELSGGPAVLSLPTDRPRPPVQTYRGDSHSFTLSDDLVQRLKTLASTEKVTLYTLLLAAFEVLVFRYTEQEDLLIGTPTLGRNHADMEKVIGYLANPVVVRANLSGNPTFTDILEQVRRKMMDALEHQDYPFPLLVERLQPKRDPGYSPLIQTLFIWDRPRVRGPQNMPGQNGNTLHAAQEALALEPFITGQQGAPFDLTLTIFEVEGSLSGDFHYNIDLFDAATIARMGQHFQVLLTSIVEQPTQRISDLPILTADERQRILVEWNDTQSDYPDNACLQQLFEQQAQRTPDAIAVVFEDTQLSYRELNRRANRVAHQLQAAGIGPDTLVGVCMERSLEMVIALLAVLKAGGAYVPLEPNYPRERLDYIIQDAQLSVFLTQTRFREMLPENSAYLLCLDDEHFTEMLQHEENPVSAVQPDNLVYVIYTSGSTGRPKGVMNIHRALANRLHWMQQAYHLTAEDRVMQKTPFSFDVSVWEFFWPLLYGARLIVARPRGHQDTAYLTSLIQEQQVTTLHFVPSMLRAFLMEQGIEGCTSIQRLICSGESFTYDLQEQFFARFDAELHNLYGPTEAAIDVTAWQCRRESHDMVVPIGRPIANTQIYILNRSLQPVPIGVVGELHIGGVGLASGYLNRPELTAEKFIADPFSSQTNARLFKSGDLARYRADGAIEFLGRIDHQVKIRGVRIELGEVQRCKRW
jgi:amino acid adenylation domain-containing protein